ncbi:MAG: M16 family metallopeptidase [Mangrovibacterium sp.]
MKTNLLLVILVFLSFSGFAQQFSDLSQPIPADTSVKTGVLPNGLTYYIKHNEYPKNLASFYIYQNVGAVLETDAQDGLAHFLEHMAFNGTNTFPGKGMLNMLERNGMKFGRDINAYTTRNETVYNISRVPVKEDNLVDSCLLILHDWCDNLTLSADEIDAERGVITEEWRSRRNVNFRTRDKIAPLLYNNTIYAKRDVIGDLNVIKNFQYNELRSFYHEWYRTDLQAVAIVGDIDVDAVEQKVIKLFSAIPAVENPKERPDVVIPDSDKTGYMQVTDPDYKVVNLNVSDRYRTTNNNTLKDLRDSYVIGFFTSLINQRIKEKQRENDVPFISGRIGVSNMERNYNSAELSVSAKPEKIADAYAAIYTELQRVIQFGFTDEEINRMKANTLMTVDKGYNNKDKITSDAYCKQIKSTYLYGVPVTSPEFSRDFSKEIIPGITKEEVAAVAIKYFNGKNRNYIVTAPPNDKDSLYITQARIEAVIDSVKHADLKPYTEKALANESLMSTTPIAGKIVSEKKIGGLDAKEWTLSNGVKVVFKYNDINKNTVKLYANSDGGSSLYDVKDLPSYNAAMNYVESYGLGEHNYNQLKRILTGKSVSSSFKFGTYNESVSASTSMGDVETMMQLTYMRFREPRFDKTMFDRVIKQNKDRLKSIKKTPNVIIKDTIATIKANGNPRMLKYNEKYLDAINYDRMIEIYRERFANPADFTFFIVGDVNEDTLKTYVEKYIASIEPTNTGKEYWINHRDYFPKGKNNHRINIKMEEPKATVLIEQKATPKYSQKNSIYQRILGSVLNLRYTENIREKEGGTYGVSVRAGSYRIPESSMTMTIGFNCDPEKADYLKTLVYKELEIAQKTIRQDDLNKVILNMKKNNSSRIENANYWITKLSNYYRYHEEGMTPQAYDELLDKITTKDIQKIAKRFLKKSDVLDFMILPE